MSTETPQTDTEDGQKSSEPTHIGSEERTSESVVRVIYESLERGTLTRYLEPGEIIDLPADRVTVEALDPEERGNTHAE